MKFLVLILMFFHLESALASNTYSARSSNECPLIQSPAEAESRYGDASYYNWVTGSPRKALYINNVYVGCIAADTAVDPNMGLSETPNITDSYGRSSTWSDFSQLHNKDLGDPFATGERRSSSGLATQCKNLGYEVTQTPAGPNPSQLESCKQAIASRSDCESLNISEVTCQSGNQARGAHEGSQDEESPVDPADEPGDRTPIAGTCSGEQELLKQEFEANCKTQHKQAHFCCGGGGAGCLVGMDPGSSGADLASVGTMLASTLIGMRQMQGMAENCDSQSGLANFGAALNGAMAAKCHSERKSCENTCEELRTRVVEARARCESDVHARTSLDALSREIVAQKRSCESLSGQEVAMASQAAMTIMTTSQMAKVCKDVIAASPPPVAPGIPGNDLCNNPSDLSNPYCRQQFCSQPGTANLPECQTQIGDVNSKLGGGGHSNFSNASYGSRLGDADLSGLGETAQPQGPGVREIDIAANGPAPIQPGMQGGAMPGGAGGGGGDSGYDTGGGGSQKLNTGILNGFSSGGGYTVSGVPMANGGGYSNPTGNGGGAAKKNEPFDLRQYLPKKAPQRNLAGLTPKGKDAIFASKHDNIFERISNKYKEFCIRKMLWCDGEEVPK